MPGAYVPTEPAQGLIGTVRGDNVELTRGYVGVQQVYLDRIKEATGKVINWEVYARPDTSAADRIQGPPRTTPAQLDPVPF